MTKMSRRGWLVALGAVAIGGGLIVSRVRADAPAGRFKDNGDGSVTDNQTTLAWQKAVDDNSFTWADAKTQCEGNQAGLPGTGWRLPRVKELQTILDRSRPSPVIDQKVFPSTPSDWFWTATAAGGSSAWLVSFHDGLVLTYGVGGVSRVRCVR